jgi:hypothetical protein
MKNTMITLGALAALLGGSVALAFPGGGGDGSPRHRPPGFEELDADGNGAVSGDEFVAPMIERLDERFLSIDANGDGELTIDELEAARPQRGR